MVNEMHEKMKEIMRRVNRLATPVSAWGHELLSFHSSMPRITQPRVYRTGENRYKPSANMLAIVSPLREKKTYATNVRRNVILVAML